MKLRIRGNSIRKRMTRSEVATLASAGIVEEFVQFTTSPNDRLVYVVQTSDAETAHAWRSGQRIGITLSKDRALLWAATDQVGIEHQQPISDRSVLRVVVENDSKCLQPRTDEDESDNFLNLTEGVGAGGLRCMGSSEWTGGRGHVASRETVPI